MERKERQFDWIFHQRDRNDPMDPAYVTPMRWGDDMDDANSAMHVYSVNSNDERGGAISSGLFGKRDSYAGVGWASWNVDKYSGNGTVFL